MKTFITKRNALFAAALGLAPFLAPHSAEAMTIYNCTDNGADFVVTSQETGREYLNTRFEPGQGQAFPAPRGQNLRVQINVIGPDIGYSDRRSHEEIRLVIQNGSYELVAGVGCP